MSRSVWRRLSVLGLLFVLLLMAPPSVGAASTAMPVYAGDGLATALALARAGGHRVEVPSLGSETEEVFADPGGTLTVDEYARPVRVRAANGGWRSIDLSLHPVNGRVVPVASPLNIRLSAGGTAPLVSLTRAGRTLDLGWPSALPTPVLSGDQATYPNVLPGVDLRVRVAVDGFAEALVVKDRTAAADPALSSIRFTTAVSGGRLRAGNAGSVDVVDSDGVSAFGAGTPMMWDAHRSVAMPVTVSAGSLTVTPDRGLLTAPGTTYPVYIDPSVTVGSNWTMINQQHPDQSYWSYDRNQGAKVGYIDEDTEGGDPWERYRSIFGFATGAVAHKHILGVVFSANLVHSYSCSNSRTDLYLVGAAGSGTTWNNHAGTWSADLASVSNKDCDDATLYTEWGGSALVSRVQTAANSGAPITLGLRAYDESSDSGWKRFDAGTAKLSITYNSYPDTPTNLTVDGHSCVTGADRPFVGSLAPTLRDTVTDPDGGSLRVYFAWPTLNADGSYPTSWPSGYVDHVASGSTAVFPLSGLSDHTSYGFRSQSNDGTDAGGTSGWCEFTVDATRPDKLPGVTAADGVYLADGNSHGGVGIAGTFTFDPGGVSDNGVDDVVGYRYGLADPPTTTIAANAMGGTASVTLTPRKGGQTTLYVQSYDRAGNLSDLRRYTFLVGSAAPPVGLWSMDDGTGTTAADVSGNGHDATLSGGATWSGGRLVAGSSDGALRLDGNSGSAATAGPVLDTSKSFAVAAWVRLTSTAPGYQTIVSQQGSHSSAFYLQYRADDQHWAFTMRRDDTDTATSVVADSHIAPVLGEWTHVAGVYDATTGQLQVYVNGQLAGATTLTTPAWNATGPLVIGRAFTSSADADYFTGDIDDVRVWNRVVFADQIQRLATAGTLVGEWDLDDATGTVASDDSGYGHPANLYFDAAWGTGHDGAGALALSGSDAQAQTATPVIRTDGSYTVSAWVDLSGLDHNAVAVSADGIYTSAFMLGYSSGSGKWTFGVHGTDVESPGLVQASSPTAAQVNTWTHLVGVYDAGAKQIRLYVNGQPVATATVTTAWYAPGPLAIGRDRVGARPADFLPGLVDDVRAYSGVLTDQQIVQLYNQ